MLPRRGLRPRAGDNEERSARLAENQLASLGWAPERCAVVAELVRATAGTSSTRRQRGRRGAVAGAAVLLDADLAVLGAEPAAYAAYVNGVRSEYGHLSPPSGRRDGRRVVEALLARSPLYATAPARSWWEERARANLHGRAGRATGCAVTVRRQLRGGGDAVRFDPHRDRYRGGAGGGDHGRGCSEQRRGRRRCTEHVDHANRARRVLRSSFACHVARRWPG